MVYLHFQNQSIATQSQSITPFLEEADFKRYIKTKKLDHNGTKQILAEKKQELTKLTQMIKWLDKICTFLYVSITHIVSFILTYHLMITPFQRGRLGSVSLPAFIMNASTSIVFPVFRTLGVLKQRYQNAKEEERHIQLLTHTNTDNNEELGAALEKQRQHVQQEYAQYKKYQKTFAYQMDALINITIVGSCMDLYHSLGDHIDSRMGFVDMPLRLYRQIPFVSADKKPAMKVVRYIAKELLQEAASIVKFSFEEKNQAAHENCVDYLLTFHDIMQNKQLLIRAQEVSSIFHHLLLEQKQSIRIYEDLQGKQLLLSFSAGYAKKIKKLTHALNYSIEKYKDQIKLNSRLHDLMDAFSKKYPAASDTGLEWFYVGMKEDTQHQFSLYFPNDMDLSLQDNLIHDLQRMTDNLKSKGITAELIIEDRTLLISLDKQCLHKMTGRKFDEYIPTQAAAFKMGFATTSDNKTELNYSRVNKKSSPPVNAPASQLKVVTRADIVSFTLPDGSVKSYDPQKKYNAVVSLGDHRYALLQDEDKVLSPEQWTKFHTTLQAHAGRGLAAAEAEQGVIKDNRGFYKLKPLGAHGDERIPCGLLLRGENRRDMLMVFEGRNLMGHSALNRYHLRA